MGAFKGESTHNYHSPGLFIFISTFIGLAPTQEIFYSSVGLEIVENIGPQSQISSKVFPQLMNCECMCVVLIYS